MKDQFEKTVAVEMRLHESVLGWSNSAYTNQYTQCLFKGFCVAYQHQQSKVGELNQHIKRLESKLDSLGSDRQGLVGQVDELQKRVDISDLKLIKLSEFIYGSGDLREYSDEELLEHQRSLKAILAEEQALKGGEA